MEIKPLSGNDTETIHLTPVLSKKQGKQLMSEATTILEKLDKYDAPADSIELYLNDRAGKYVRMLEGLVDVAAENGLLETTSMLLFGLLRLTALGRTKTDVTVTGVTKLREEGDMSGLTDDELDKLAAKVKPRA